MGMEYFAEGVFGINLCKIEKLELLINELYSEAGHVAYDEEADESHQEQIVRHINKLFLKRTIKELSALGIKMPKGVRLHYSGSSDDNMRGCATDADEWLIGYGMYLEPWKIPTATFDKSFKREAELHTWVSAG